MDIENGEEKTTAFGAHLVPVNLTWAECGDFREGCCRDLPQREGAARRFASRAMARKRGLP